MKKYLLSLLFIGLSVAVFAQKNASTGVILPSEFHLTKPLREIFKDYPLEGNGEEMKKKKESGDRKWRKAQEFKFGVNDGPQYGNDPQVMQKEMGKVEAATNKVAWSGQTASGFRPYDPSGAVGPNHYVQMINSTTFRMYNKTGTVLLSGTLGNLWNPVTGNAGDPIVMYDKAADRWFLAQFGTSADKKVYIAVSQTNDPTGAYYTYTYVSPAFPDYIKFGVWSDGYYMTSNQAQKVFAFERNAMLVGTPGARSIYTSYTPPQGSGFFCPMPGDAADGDLPPLGTPCPIFSYSDNAWGGTNIDAVHVYQMAVNWVPTTPTAIITSAAVIPTAAFDASYNSSWNDCDQPGTTQKLDGIGGIIMYRTQWKKWNGYNTVLVNWGVKLAGTQRSIKWAELRQDQTTNVWSLYQEGIYTPDAATRWMGSIAMDNNGSIGLSYIKSDATSIYPGLYYTGRRVCDPLGTLPVTEVQVVAGTGYQTGTNRVGDYSHSTLDPSDGVTFWSTSEFMGGASGGSAARTHIFSYQITPCGNGASVAISLTSGTNPKCPSDNITFTATPYNGGSAPSYQWQINGTNVGTNSPTFTTNSITNGQNVTCIMTSNLPGVTGSPATSSPYTVSVSPVVTPSVSIAQTSGTNPTCTGLNVTFTATPTNGGTAPSYQWKVNGANVGTNSASFSSTTLTNGQIITCVLTSSALCTTTSTATSNGITINVTTNQTPSLSISQTSGSNPTCAGNSVTFTATPSNAFNPTYQWKVNGSNVGTNSATFTSNTLNNNDLVTCSISAQPTCPSIYTLGTGTTTNSTTSDAGAAYPTYYGSGRQQYLIRASELTALGMTAGNITDLAFQVAGTVGNPSTLNGYTIKLANTTATATTTTFIVPSPTFTTVFGPVNYTPALNSTNTHTLSTPFAWNGTSNIVVDICFSNGVTGVTAYQTYQTTSSFFSTTYYQVDGATSTACTQATGTRASVRPNMIFTKGVNLTANSNAVTMGITTSVTPTISIAVSSGSNPMCAGNSITFTASTTNAGSSPTYVWKKGTTVVGGNSNTYTTNIINNLDNITCTLTSSDICANPTTVISSPIVMNVNALPTVSASNVSGCAGNSIALIGSPAGGTFSKANPYTGPSTTYTYSFTDANGCSNTSSAASITTNALPSVSASNVTGCAGNAITLIGSPVGGTFSQANPYTGPSTTYTYSFTDANGCSNTSSAASITTNALPSVSASNVTGCAGNAITLIGSPVGGTFSQANPYTGPSTTYTYSFTDANGCSNTSSAASITTNALPTVSASNVTGCAGNAIILIGSPAGGTFSKANPYTGPSTTYTYSFTDANGCSNTSSAASITTNALPSVSASNVTGCAGTAIALIGSPAGGTFSQANPYTGPSTTYTYSFTDANGCSNTSSAASITTNALPSVSASNVTGCAGSAITLIGSPAGGTFSQANPYTGPSTTYTYSFTDANGCSNTSSAASITSQNSADIVLANAGNANSIPGNTCQSNTLGNSVNFTFTNTPCIPMVKINDLVAGTGLGSTQVCVNVATSPIVANNGQLFTPRSFVITPSVNEASDIVFYLTQDDLNDYNASSGSLLQMPVSGNNSDPNIANVRIAQLTSGNITSGAYAALTPSSFVWNSIDLRWEANLSVSSSAGSYYFFTNPACNLVMPAVSVSNITSTSALLNWNAVAGASEYDLRIRPVGATTWNSTNTTTNSKSLIGLTPSTAYEAQSKVRCNTTSSGLWGNLFNFTTSATTSTCPIPTGLAVGAITATSAQINWNNMGNPTSSYVLRYRVIGSNTWLNAGCPTNSRLLSNLAQGTSYEVQVSSYCVSLGQQTTYTASVNFNTPAQCTVPTGVSSTGITSNSVTIVWNAMGAPTTSYVLRYRIQGSSTWNNAGCPTNSRYLGGLISGATYQVQVSTYCASIGTQTAYGPIYTFTTLGNSCPTPTNILASNITTSQANISWTDVAPPATGNRYILRYKEATATTWNNAGCPSNNRTLVGLLANSTYQVEVQSNCSATFNTSPFSSTYTFNTSGNAGKPNEEINTLPVVSTSKEIKIYPNPTTDRIHIELNNEDANECRVEIREMTGRLLKQTTLRLEKGENLIEMELGELDQSFYVVQVYIDRKLVHISRIRKTE